MIVCGTVDVVFRIANSEWISRAVPDSQPNRSPMSVMQCTLEAPASIDKALGLNLGWRPPTSSAAT